jgi:peroxiredoxin
MARKPFVGERAPDFVLPTPTNPKFHLSAAAGRSTILVFPGSPVSPAMKGLMAELRALRDAFDDDVVALFHVVSDPSHLSEHGIRQDTPGIRYFMDYERVAAAAYALTAPEPAATSSVEPRIFALDRNHRVLRILDFKERKPYLRPLLVELKRLHERQNDESGLNHAPVLLVEDIFEPALCRALIDHYRRLGGRDSGFMREDRGMTVGVVDHGFKRRSDCSI